MFEMILQGLRDFLTIPNIIFANFGMLMGIVFGAIPGVSADLAIVIMLPVTFSMDPITGIILLMSIYCGGAYGGSISSILLNTPGTNVAVATTFDGYPLAQKGQAKKALGMALVASTIGGLISAFTLLFTAPIVAKFAIKFAPPEYFALAIFGLSIIAGISGKNLAKGLVAGCLGVIVSVVGIDASSGAARFTFGNVELYRGLGLLPVLLGVFAIPTILNKLRTGEHHNKPSEAISYEGSDTLTKEDMKKSMPTILKSSVIGVIIGAIPGAGAAIAAFFSYNEARRTSKHPERFGRGELLGVAAPESANNAVTAASFIPLFTLGIPGSVAAATMVGAFTMQGMVVGPMLFSTQGDVIYAIMVGLFFVNIFMLIQGRYLIRAFSKITKVPQTILIVVLTMFCVIGAFSFNNSPFDMYVLFGCGIIMYLLGKLDIPGAPFVLGIILGPLAESNLKRSMVMSEGSWSIFFTRPLSLLFLVITVVFTAYSIVKMRSITKVAIENDGIEIEEDS